MSTDTTPLRRGTDTTPLRRGTDPAAISDPDAIATAYVDPAENVDREPNLVARTATTPRTALLVGSGFLLPWLFWGSKIAESRGLVGWHLPQGLALWSMLPSLVLATAATAGRAGLRDLGGRLLRWRVPVRCYVLALAIPVGLAAASLAVVALLGGELHVGTTLPFGAAVVYLGYGTGLYLFTEEAVWRGLVLPRLQARMRPVAAGLTLGLVWSVWHVPLLSVPGEHDNGLPLPGFVVLITATTILISTLVNAAGGSVVVAAVFHAAFNAAYSFTGVVGTDHAAFWVATALSMLAAGAAIRLTGGRLGLPPAR
jgi:membrane protease YdiL (CAAX protease family)